MRLKRFENFQSDDKINIRKFVQLLTSVSDDEAKNLIENFLENADDYDKAQQNLISYVTDDIEDDKKRIRLTNIIQDF